MKQCQFIYADGQACQNKAIGLTCKKHAKYAAEVKRSLDEERFAQKALVGDLLGVLLAQPAIAGVVGKITGFIDKSGSILDQVATGDYSAFKAKEKPTQTPPATGPDPRKLMGFRPGVVLTEKEIRDRRKDLAKIYHSDTGSSEEMLKDINAAADQLLRELKKK